MYENNLEINLERRRDLEREAQNARLIRSAQNEEKPNILRNVLNIFNKHEERNQA